MTFLEDIKSRYPEIKEEDILYLSNSVYHDGKISGFITTKNSKYFFEWIENFDVFPEEEELDYHYGVRHYLVLDVGDSFKGKQLLDFLKEVRSSSYDIIGWVDETNLIKWKGAAAWVE